MRNLVNRKEGRRSLGSVTKSLVAVGATSALMLAGLAFVAVSPAAAAVGTHLAFTSGPSTTTTAGATLSSFAVTIEDVSNAPATGSSASDTVAITSSCTLTGATSVGASSAVATFTSVVITVGTACTLTASDTTSGDTGFTAATSATITVTAAAANKIIYTTAPATSATLGVGMPLFRAAIEDTYGNVETSNSSDNIAITTPTSGCALSTTYSGQVASGAVSFSSVTFSSGTSCLLTATDTTNSGLTAATATVTVATTAPSKVGFTTGPSATAIAGTVLPSFAVSVEESNGIPITSGTGATDAVVITSTCALTGTTAATAVAGVATFTAVTIKTGSTCTLIAADSSRVLTTGTSTAIVIAAGAATQVAFTTAPPASVTTASSVLTVFKVSVEDVNGNVVTSGTGATDTVAITSPCTLGGTTTAAAVAGVATFSALTVNVTGVCVLTATDSARTLTAATATTTVGTPQAALVLATVKGTVGKSLNLATHGGTGTGALSYTVAAGSSAGCTVSGTSLSAKRAGTCLVTATKAGSTTYIVVSSAATKVTFVLPFKVTRVAGAVTVGRTSTVTFVGSGFTGRPRIISNVGGVTARVSRDSGRTLTVIVAVRAGVKTGVHTFTVILANGKRTSVKFSLR